MTTIGSAGVTRDPWLAQQFRYLLAPAMEYPGKGDHGPIGRLRRGAYCRLIGRILCEFPSSLSRWPMGSARWRFAFRHPTLEKLRGILRTRTFSTRTRHGFRWRRRRG